MQQLTPAGQNIINDISRRYNLSYDSTVSMLASVNRGGGSMAQFSCPELGSGQWMRGGMTMVGDLFNHGLKATVNNLCGELSNALASTQMFPPTPQGAFGGNNWWPDDLGRPSSSGSQNNIRYAFFPQAQRLVVERNGQVTVFNTLNHNISGVSQQQGGNTSLTFSSQFGTISTLNLPLVTGPGLLPPASNTNFAVASPPPAYQAPLNNNNNNNNNFAAPQPPPQAPAPAFQAQPQTRQQGQATNYAASDVMGLLEKLGQLRDSGILTPEEFVSKKTELLSRL